MTPEPAVTCVVTQYLQKYPSATPAQVQNWIVNSASVGNLSRNAPFPAYTADRFLYTDL